MASGDYEKAVEYYMAEASLNPTDALVRKITQATILKNEFSAIDRAINDRDPKEMELHIANVLMIDPNNRFAPNKRTQYANSVSREKKEKVGDVLGSVFSSNQRRMEVFGVMDFEQGVNLLAYPGHNDSIRGFTSVQRFFTRGDKYPIALEFFTQIGTSKSNPHKMWGLGLGSYFYIGNHISVDYGLGFHRNKLSFNDMQKDKGMYYRAGVTLMENHGLGLCYSFNHYTFRNGPSFNSHQITMVASISGERDYDNDPGAITGYFVFLWHMIATGIVIVGMLRKY